MKLDSETHNSPRSLGTAAWLLAMGMLAVALGYAGWLFFADSFAANQSRLHPLLAGRIVLSDLSTAAPPWEWNVPLWSVAVAIIWFFGVWTCGSAMLRRVWQHVDAPLSVRAVLSFAAGFTLFGWLQMLLAMAGAARVSLVPVFAAAGALLLWRSPAVRQAATAPARAFQWHWQSSGRGWQSVVIGLGATAVLMLPPALTPPAQSDGVRYHLGAPQEFLKNGSAAFLPGNAYSNMPLLVEMHFMAALGIGAPEASQLVHLIIALVTAAGIYALVRLLAVGSRTAGNPALPLVPALLYLTMPMAAIVATWPYTDHGLAMMLTASTIAAILCLRNRDFWQLWLLLGVCLGGLIGTKYTMAPMALLIYLLCLGLSLWHKNHAISGCRYRITIRAALASGVAATIIGGIWFLRNWLFIGNPVYPFATSLFPGGDWGPANDAFLNARAGAKGFGKSLVDLVKLPWTATFRWHSFEGHNPGAGILAATLISVCAVIVAIRPGAARAGSRMEQLFVFVIAIASALLWFFTYQGNRLLLPTLAVSLALLPVHCLRLHPAAAKLFAAGAGLCAVMGLIWAVQWSWVVTELTPRPVPYLSGQISKESFRYRSLTYARAFDYLNERVKPGERVLLVGEHRIYGAEFNAIWSDWFDTPALVRVTRQNGISTTDELLQYLRSTRTVWIMINEEELEPQLESDFRPRFRSDEWAIFEGLRSLSRDDVEVIKLPPGSTIIRLRAAE